MPYYDPYRRRFVAESDSQIEPLSDGTLVLVRSRDPDAPWFVHDTWTATSLRVEDLGDGKLRSLAEQAAARCTLRERLLQRCDDVRGFDQVPPMSESEGEAALDRALSENLHRPGVDAAISVARSRGFLPSEIALALHVLEDQPALSDALDGVEVVSVSQLVERRAPAD